MSRAVFIALLIGLCVSGCQSPERPSITPVTSPAPPIPPSAVETNRPDPPSVTVLDAETLGRLFELALDCVHQEYPNVVLHALSSDGDAQPPRVLHPAFYGCFDWHSAVHGHWLLARLAHLYPDHDSAPAAREALFISLTEANIAGELAYLNAPGRGSFERPYGLAWVLQLDQELGDWADSGEPLADDLRDNIEPLAQESANRLLRWLQKLTHPIRSGTHGQSAFAMGLLFDWARANNRPGVTAIVREQTERLYGKDRNCPIGYEPSGHDFLSHCLATADLMRRVLSAQRFEGWLDEFLPGLGTPALSLRVAAVADPTDGHLVHLDGLNLSRAWMLNGIASALPEGHPRRPGVLAAAADHQAAGMASIIDPHYAGGHWLGSFATYLVTDRGIHQQ